jgi:para-aminobenzoate synthetase component 1
MKSKNPVEEFQKINLTDQNLVFLHSGKGGKSFLAKNPIAKFNGEIKDLEKFIRKHNKCLVVGYISYDTSYDLYKIKQSAADDLKLPKVYFLAFDKWQEFQTKEEQDFKIKKFPKTKIKAKNFKAKITAKEYKSAYNKIKNYLKEGDIYQINLTHRLEGKTGLHPRELFQRIIQKNRVDFLSYIEGDGFEILSASPERFIRINEDQIETYPVKGTRPRGKTKKEDEQLQKDLIEDIKEAAELNMITDLLRND